MEELWKEPQLRILTRRMVEAIFPLAATVVVSMKEEFDEMSGPMIHSMGLSLPIRVYLGFTNAAIYNPGMGLNFMYYVNHG